MSSHRRSVSHGIFTAFNVMILFFAAIIAACWVYAFKYYKLSTPVDGSTEPTTTQKFIKAITLTFVGLVALVTPIWYR